ncbi:hypothetical protein CW304_26320 [Bacillus sp. UFRGS-B20]|nr:hypothetical protein CW304_26320 [Bacillus sp. UFRGS-B20]
MVKVHHIPYLTPYPVNHLRDIFVKISYDDNMHPRCKRVEKRFYPFIPAICTRCVQLSASCSVLNRVHAISLVPPHTGIPDNIAREIMQPISLSTIPFSVCELSLDIGISKQIRTYSFHLLLYSFLTKRRRGMYHYT